MNGAPQTLTVIEGQWDELIRRAAQLLGGTAAGPAGAEAAFGVAELDPAALGGGRRLLGIAGAPGAGKSTLAGRVAQALAPAAVLVPMDGFHLAEAELHRLGRHQRKGAIDTFDSDGFVALLRRLREERSEVVYAPEFRREIEEPIAGAIPVPRDAALVVTEGNYLLADDGAWARVRGLLDEVWFLELDERVRVERLTARHMAYGRPAQEARERANGSDARNAELIAETRQRASLIIQLVPSGE